MATLWAATTWVNSRSPHTRSIMRMPSRALQTLFAGISVRWFSLPGPCSSNTFEDHLRWMHMMLKQAMASLRSLLVEHGLSL